MIEIPIERPCRKSESWLQERGREVQGGAEHEEAAGAKTVDGKPTSSCCRVCVSAPPTPAQDGTPEVQRENAKRPTYYSEEILHLLLMG